MTEVTLNPIWPDALDQLDQNNMWPNRIEPNKRSEFCGLSKPGKPCEPTSSNYQVNIINQAPMFTFSSFVSSPVFSWKHHLPLEDAHRTLHISLLSIMTNRKSITGTKPSKYKQMPEKYRKKRVLNIRTLKKSEQPADVSWRGRSVCHKKHHLSL